MKEPLNKLIGSNNMSKTFNEEIAKNQPDKNNYTHAAVGIYKNEKTGQFFIVEVEYDPVTKQAGKVTMENATENRLVANDKFKVKVVQNNIL